MKHGWMKYLKTPPMEKITYGGDKKMAMKAHAKGNKAPKGFKPSGKMKK